jgi:hypothetical protein
VRKASSKYLRGIDAYARGDKPTFTYFYACTQQGHSADAHEDKRQDGKYPHAGKGVMFLILTSPIGLHCKDFLIK